MISNRLKLRNVHQLVFMWLKMEKVRQISDNSFEIELVPNTVTITFKVDDELLKKVDLLVRELGFQNRSELIREAIVTYLKYLDGI